MKTPNVTRPGRPKSEEKRAAILCAASNLFLTRGLAGTSMDAVAENAGVSKQTVYSHFSSKDVLFRAFIENKIEAYGFLQEGFPEDGDLKALLTQYGRQFLDLIFDEEVLSMYRVVIGESAVHSKIAELFFETGPARTIDAYARFIEAQMNAGRLKRDDPRFAAVVYLNMMRAHYHMQLLMSIGIKLTEEDLDRHVDKAVGQFLELYGV